MLPKFNTHKTKANDQSVWRTKLKKKKKKEYVNPKAPHSPAHTNPHPRELKINFLITPTSSKSSTRTPMSLKSLQWRPIHFSRTGLRLSLFINHQNCSQQEEREERGQRVSPRSRVGMRVPTSCLARLCITLSKYLAEPEQIFLRLTFFTFQFPECL